MFAEIRAKTLAIRAPKPETPATDAAKKAGATARAHDDAGESKRNSEARPGENGKAVIGASQPEPRAGKSAAARPIAIAASRTVRLDERIFQHARAVRFQSSNSQGATRTLTIQTERITALIHGVAA